MMNTLTQTEFVKALEPSIGTDEASAVGRLVFEKINRYPEQGSQLQSWLIRLLQHEPMQYVLGEAWFYDFFLEVNHSVLIPRPETEELVQLILQSYKHKPAVRILDIGTGSGCIAIALAKHLPQSQVYAIDVSEKALEVAKQNAISNKVSIQFEQADILNFTTPGFPKFDLIVSNPPYITLDERTQMHPNVVNYEPANALFVTNQDPLQFYKAIVKFAETHLLAQGQLFFETNTAFANEVVKLLVASGYDQSALVKDMSGNNRIVYARKK